MVSVEGIATYCGAVRWHLVIDAYAEARIWGASMRLINAIIVFGIWEFVWMLGYLVLRRPAVMTMSAINNSTTIPQVASTFSVLVLVLDICFGLAVVGGIIWFGMMIHNREYEPPYGGY